MRPPKRSKANHNGVSKISCYTIPTKRRDKKQVNTTKLICYILLLIFENNMYNEYCSPKKKSKEDLGNQETHDDPKSGSKFHNDFSVSYIIMIVFMNDHKN